MTMWLWVLGAAAACFLQKLIGYLVPAEKLESPMFSRLAGSVTVGLLAALVVTQTFAIGGTLVLDARVASVAAAVIALLLRAPFIVVVVVGAITAAGLRALGWAA